MPKPYLPTLFTPRGDEGLLFHSLKSDIDRVFRDFDDFAFPSFFQPERRYVAGAVQATLDIAETPTHVEVEIELPGVRKDDLNVSAVGDLLIIKGEKKTESSREDRNMHCVERRFGRFERSLPLGFRVDPDAVEASFEDGVLSVSVRKPEEAVAKTHQIQISGQHADAEAQSDQSDEEDDESDEADSETAKG